MSMERASPRDAPHVGQHNQMGETAYSVNEHGAKIEHTIWRPSRLDEERRCCGRKAHEYKTRYGLNRIKDHHFCCFRCSREYAPDGEQRPNWAYVLDDANNYVRDRPIGKSTDIVT